MQKFGRYYLRELLNSGGMADIWLASDSRGKPFALRKLKKELRFSFTARRRFSRGNKILSQLGDHENIVGYVEHGSDYLLMDYIEAENLKTLVAKQDPVKQICALLGGKILFSGTIVAKQNILKKYFTAGILTIRADGSNASSSATSAAAAVTASPARKSSATAAASGGASSSDDLMLVDYINENICARIGSKYVATSPDCISILDADSGEALYCDQYRFGNWHKTPPALCQNAV